MKKIEKKKAEKYPSSDEISIQFAEAEKEQDNSQYAYGVMCALGWILGEYDPPMDVE